MPRPELNKRYLMRHAGIPAKKEFPIFHLYTGLYNGDHEFVMTPTYRDYPHMGDFMTTLVPNSKLDFHGGQVNLKSGDYHKRSVLPGTPDHTRLNSLIMQYYERQQSSDNNLNH